MLKRSLLVVLLTMMIICNWSGLIYADEQKSAAPVFNAKVMHQLQSSGYAWGDLVQGSVLTYRYQIPLETILHLKSTEEDWRKVEEGLKAWNIARKMLQQQTELIPEISALLEEDFSEAEIAYIAFQGKLKKETLVKSADTYIKEKKQEKNLKELREAKALSLTIDPQYTAMATDSVTNLDPGLGYDVEKLTPFSPVFQTGNESIEPSTGFLSLTETDLTLPGRNGLDFNLTRVYRSEKADLQKVGYYSNVVNGELEVRNRLFGLNSVDTLYHLGVGWSFNFPLIEMVITPEYEIPMYLHLGQGTTYKIDYTKETRLESTLKDYTFGECSSSNYPKPVNAYYFLKHISGVTYFFDYLGKLIQTQNQYGDTIRYEWDNEGYLIKVTDTVNRVITFSYTPTLITVKVSSTSTPYEVKYYKRQRSESGARGQYELYQVDLPEQTRISYSYEVGAVEFNFYDGQPLTNYYLNLKKRTNPYQGVSFFDYSNNYSQRTAFPLGYIKYFKVIDRYNTVQEIPQNYTRFTYTNHDVKDQNYTTKIEYMGNSTSSPIKTEVLTFDKEHTNIQTVTTIAGNSCQETKTISYYRKLPEQIVLSKSGTTETLITDIDYDEYGNVIRSKDHQGRWTESQYQLKTQASQWSNFMVQNWSMERIQTKDQNSFVTVSNVFDSYGNVLSSSSRESTGSYTQVTESFLSQAISLSKPWFTYLPESTSKVVLNITVGSEDEVKVRYWQEGSARPENASITLKSSNSALTLNLDLAMRYILEVSGNKTLNSVNVTYNKLNLTESSVKETTYYHYESPSTFGQPDQIHQEYGSGGVQHSTSFGTDSCIVTRFEYLSTAVDNPVAGENYANLFLTKSIQNVINADQQSVQEISEMRYNRFGNVTQIKKDSLTNKYEYDGINRLKVEIYQSDSAPGEALRKEYFYSTSPDARGYYYTEISHKDEVGNGATKHITRYYYNALGQHMETQKGSQSSPVTIEKVQYDAFGRKAQVEDGIGVKTAYEYDGYGRTKKVKLIDITGVLKGYNTFVYYDASRRVTEEFHDLTGTDKVTGKTVKSYDLLGQLVQVTQYPVATGSTTYTSTYKYDLRGQLIEAIDPRNVKMTYEYDYFGLKKIDYPGTLRKDDVYICNYLDKTKQLKKELAINSYIITEYDELNRVRKETYPDGRVLKNYYDAAGRLSRTILNSSTQSTEIAYEYDLTGNVSKATHTYDGASYILRFGYDEKGNVTSITYPDGYSISYTYDTYGRVKTIPGLVGSVEYLNNGFIKKVNYITQVVSNPPTSPNPKEPPIVIDDPINPGLLSVSTYETTTVLETTTYTPDNLGRIQSIQNDYMNYSYTYDVKGNVTAITGSDQFTGETSYSYTYNDLDWLKTANHGGTTYVYNYDAAGNRTSQVINGNTISYTYDPAHLNLLTKMNGTSVLYDEWGNITKRDNGFEYSFNNSNQLTEVRKKGRVVENNYYNSEGKRYKKIESGKGTNYVYHGEVLLYAEATDGTKINYIYLNGKQIAKVETKNGVQSKYYYFTDHLGSTRGMISYDGKLVGTVYYEPFGDEKPYYPGRDSSYPNQTSLESTSDITGRLSGTLELTTDCVEGDYALLAKIGDDPYDFTNLSLATKYQGTMNTEEARYYHIWVKPEEGAEWVYFAFSDDDDTTKDYEYLTPDDHERMHRVGKELQPNVWNLIVLDMREGTEDGVDRRTNHLKMFTDDNSQWKWDYFGVSVKDPVTFTGKQQDDTTGLYYFNARYYDPDLGRFIMEDPIRDGANWYVYCENNALKYIDKDGLLVRVAITGQVVGKADLRICGPGNNTQEVPTYRVIVTDDITNTVSFYEVTRDALVYNNNSIENWAFEPIGKTDYFWGWVGVKNDKVGPILELRDKNNGQSPIVQSTFGERSNIQIHVGGIYEYNGILYRTGSLGCFTLAGPYSGNAGIDQFINDILTRLKQQTKDVGQRIHITVENRME